MLRAQPRSELTVNCWPPQGCAKVELGAGKKTERDIFRRNFLTVNNPKPTLHLESSWATHRCPRACKSQKQTRPFLILIVLLIVISAGMESKSMSKIMIKNRTSLFPANTRSLDGMEVWRRIALDEA